MARAGLGPERCGQRVNRMMSAEQGGQLEKSRQHASVTEDAEYRNRSQRFPRRCRCTSRPRSSGIGIVNVQRKSADLAAFHGPNAGPDKNNIAATIRLASKGPPST